MRLNRFFTKHETIGNCQNCGTHYRARLLTRRAGLCWNCHFFKLARHVTEALKKRGDA